jgi:hypothetical protein
MDINNNDGPPLPPHPPPPDNNDDPMEIDDDMEDEETQRVMEQETEYLTELQVFLHKSIRRILKISMFRVINEIRNEQVRTTFYAMPCVRT